MSTYHLIIEGKVQGVFYRASAKKIADQIGVTGWIRNTEDDRVEAIAKGTEEQVRQFIVWCRQGPPFSNVTAVVSTKIDEIQMEDFTIKK